MGEATFVAVIAKVVPLSVEVDGVSGAPTIDQRRLGISAADHAALAVARDLGDATSLPVHLFSVCAAAGEATLCAFASQGADHAVRLSLSGTEMATTDWSRSWSSAVVAEVLANAVADAQYVVAGDHSIDRGSGSVPARLAQRLEWAQILGALEIDPAAMTAVRRLDFGWREQLRIGPRTVLSVEASAGRPKRASPSALRAARLEVRHVQSAVSRTEGEFHPYRVAVDVVPAPSQPVAARRAMEVIGALQTPKRREVLTVSAQEAAAVILERMASWGYR